jgi:hypothetical protein
MNADAVLAELSAMGVSVVCPAPDTIRLSAAVGLIPPDATTLARNNKAKLLDWFKTSCVPHNDPNKYVEREASNRPGWVRVTCRRCGRFLGYKLR